VKCPKCQHENPADAAFCSRCAAPLPSFPGLTETAPAPLVRELASGQTFAGRYQVIEELGKGGMGKVYRVLDTKLKEEVALKLIRYEIASDRETIERFGNELKLARKIGHRNVGRMYELLEAGGTHFITMEYVAGEDLKSFIRRSRQLTVGTAIAIAKQVAEGLAEAHRLGVVHRDLKPGNIMIDKDGNARIMDFGIARSLAGQGITGAGVMIGTPEYMSPEQVEGKEADQRSDIYSLGVVLYQMVTGRVPFEGDTPLSVAVKQKTEAPPSPRTINPQIPEDLSRAILRCLEKEKEKRYQTAEEVLGDLDRIEKGIPTAERIIPTKERLTSREITVKFRLEKLIIPAAALVAIAAIGIVLIKVLPKKAAAPAAPSMRSIAVLPFENLGDPKEDEAFTSGISEDINTLLSKISELDVRSQTSAMRYKETSLGIKEIGRELNVAYILDGSVRRADGQMRITARLIDAAADKTIWAEPYNRDLKDIFSIQNDIAQKIATALKATLTPAEKERLEKKPTKDIGAYEYYLKGREYYSRYRKEDNEQAIELFKKAIELDPDYALAHAGLGDAYFQRVIRFEFPEAEWFERAVEEAQKAISLDPGLPEGYKALGGLYGSGKGWWKKAGEAFQKAFEANPNDAVACLSVGTYYYKVGEPDKAFPFLKKAIALRPGYAFPIYQLGRVYYQLDDPGQAENWLKKSLELQPDLDAAHERLIYLYLAYGEYDKAIEQSQTALSKFPGGPSAFLKEDAPLPDLFSGHYEKAQEYYQKIGSQSVELGYIYWKTGKRDEARKLFQENLARLQNRLEQGDEDWGLRFEMAAIYAVQGNNDEALKWLEKAVDAGWSDYNYALRYPLFENIRNDERFKKIMDDAKAKVAEMRRRVEQLAKEGSG
jgi:TolB-like protein/predicted Ser/Thr protein kinase/lipoprotein NlpI